MVAAVRDRSSGQHDACRVRQVLSSEEEGMAGRPKCKTCGQRGCANRCSGQRLVRRLDLTRNPKYKRAVKKPQRLVTGR